MTEPTRPRVVSDVPDPLSPPLTTLVKLGSIAVHAQELTSPSGHGFDKIAMDDLLADREVVEWIEAMGAFLPVKR
jgi:hypothetical protein